MSLPIRLSIVQFGASQYLCEVTHFQIFPTRGKGSHLLHHLVIFRDSAFSESFPGNIRKGGWPKSVSTVGRSKQNWSWISLEVSVDKQQQAREGSTLGEERGETGTGTRGLTWAVWGGHTLSWERSTGGCMLMPPAERRHQKAMTPEPGNSPQYSFLQNCNVEFYSWPHILGKERETSKSQLTSSGITQQSSLRSRQLGAHLFNQSCSPPSGRALVTQGKQPTESNMGACGGGVGTIGRHREEALGKSPSPVECGEHPSVSVCGSHSDLSSAGARQIVWGRCCTRPVEHSL